MRARLYTAAGESRRVMKYSGLLQQGGPGAYFHQILGEKYNEFGAVCVVARISVGTGCCATHDSSHAMRCNRGLIARDRRGIFVEFLDDRA